MILFLPLPSQIVELVSGKYCLALHVDMDGHITPMLCSAACLLIVLLLLLLLFKIIYTR